MGAIQAAEWTAAYPSFVQRAITVIPGGFEADAYLIGMTNRWAAPILLDPNWNNGDYYGRTEPTRGLAEALKQVTLDARHYGWAARTFGRKWAAADRNPLDGFANKFAIEDTLDRAGAGRAATSDANSFLYLVRANQLFQLGHAGNTSAALDTVQARFLVVPAKSDLLLFPDWARRMTAQLKEKGKSVEYFEIEGDGGHLDGVLDVAKAGEAIRGFLAK
jgi:homoserine O-acetyltransferase